MRRLTSLFVLLICLVGQTCTGQEPSNSSLIVHKNWVRFDLVLGRISATQIRSGRRNCTRVSGPADTRRELLSVSCGTDDPTIRYELEDREQYLTVEILRRREVQILREPKPGSPIKRLEFTQPATGNLQVTVGDLEHPEVSCTATSMWHLLLTEPVMCQRDLLPVLDILRPQWQLAETAGQIEADLFRAAANGEGLVLANVVEMVDQLDSPRFSARQHADRRLRALGVAVLPQLQSLDRISLTREQRQRIDRIAKDLALLEADTPQRIVAWMLNDEATWLSMLSRNDVLKRQIAAARLAEAYPSANKFDPTAAEQQRQRQIDLLRLRISDRR